MSQDISMFDTRTMLSALEQSKPATTFLLDTFFPNSQTHTTSTIDIDIVDKMGRKMAPFVSPRLEGKVIKKNGFKTRSYTAPYIKEKTITNALDILKRDPGQTIYTSNDSPAVRAARELGKDLSDLRELIMRRMEWMAAQLLATGTLVIKGDGIDDEIDFQMKSTHKITLSGAALWTASTSDPIKDIETWAELVGQDSGIYPTDVIFGSAVADAFRTNAAVKSYLDTRKMEFGTLAPQQLADGVKYIIYLPSAGVTVWTYAESYYDEDTASLQTFVPAKKIFMGSRNAYTKRHFGVIKDLEAGQEAAVPMFPKTWLQKDPSAQMLLLQSAPLVAMHQVDAFLVAQPVA